MKLTLVRFRDALHFPGFAAGALVILDNFLLALFN